MSKAMASRSSGAKTVTVYVRDTLYGTLSGTYSAAVQRVEDGMGVLRLLDLPDGCGVRVLQDGLLDLVPAAEGVVDPAVPVGSLRWGVDAARPVLGGLVDAVAAGQRVVLTRRGQVVAVMVRPGDVTLSGDVQR